VGRGVRVRVRLRGDEMPCPVEAKVYISIRCPLSLSLSLPFSLFFFFFFFFPSLVLRRSAGDACELQCGMRRALGTQTWGRSGLFQLWAAWGQIGGLTIYTLRSPDARANVAVVGSCNRQSPAEERERDE